MKICDRCGCETKNLTQLLSEFEDMEVCQNCLEPLQSRCNEIAVRIAKITMRARQRAFQAWKGEDSTPIRVRRSFDFFRSIFGGLIYCARRPGR